MALDITRTVRMAVEMAPNCTSVGNGLLCLHVLTTRNIVGIWRESVNLCTVTAKASSHSFGPVLFRGIFQRIEASPLGTRLARGAFWSLAGSLISRGLGLLSAIIVGRLLGKEDFGELGIMQNTIATFGVLAGFGMGLTSNKHVAEFKHTDPVRAGRIIVLASIIAWISSGAMAVALFLSAPWLAATTLAAPQLSSVLQVGALLLFLSGINGAQTGALSGFEAFKTVARINLLSGLLAFPLMVGGAWRWGVHGAMWALIGSQLINCLMCYFAVRAEAAQYQIPLSIAGGQSEKSLFWSFSIPAVLTGVLNSSVSWGAGVLLVNQAGGYGEMGIYSAALRVKLLPETFIAMLIAPILPILSEAFGKGDRVTFQKTLRFSFLLATLIIAPVSLLQTAAPTLTLLPFGPDYQGHPGIVQSLMLHAVLYGLLFPLGGVLISTGRMWFSWIVNALYAMLLGVSAWYLVPRYGASGYAASMALAFGIANLPCLIFLYCRFPDEMRVLRWASEAVAAGLLFVLCRVASTNLWVGWSTGVGILSALAFMALQYRLHASVTLKIDR